MVLALLFLSAFLWSVKDGQFDDDFTPAVRILFEDEIRSDSEGTVDNGHVKKNQDI